MNLTGFRESVAQVLAAMPEVTAGEWTVHPLPVDALEPPAFMLSWGPDPWRVISSTCVDDAQLEVVVVSSRLTPEGESLPTLEDMVDAAVTELATARLRPHTVLRPSPTEIGAVAYLAARLQIRRPVTTNGGTRNVHADC